MNKNNYALLIAMSLVLTTTMSVSVTAAESNVTWTDPDSYRDIRPSQSQSRKNFEKRVFKELEEHFAKLAAQLPADQMLEIDVKDVDLAGDTNVSMNRVRVVKEIYYPRIKFSYQLLNKDKSIVSSGEINLKDMSFMVGNNLKYRNDSFGYEKKMLDDWFRKTFNSDNS